MSPGIRAEVRVDGPTVCPIARLSAETGESSYSISKSVDPAGSGTVTEEFMLDADAPVDGASLGVDDLGEVFSYGAKRVYRFSRPGGRGCPCECVEQYDSPVVDVHTRDGALYLAFHAADIEMVQDIIGTLRERYPDLDVQRLLRSRRDQSDQHLVFVDRSELTDRQREVLETAHEMGYFEHPKGANAGEVAEALGITTSTFTEHLASAQKKLLGAILSA
ncbi:MAG: helix-turn-helix domain-containing protein [Halobacteriales archaeon]